MQKTSNKIAMTKVITISTNYIKPFVVSLNKAIQHRKQSFSVVMQKE